jgi:hypothetical protein
VTVLDHVFIFCSTGAPEAAALTRLGLVEGTPNTHPGQGTACRRFFFRNAYLELLWVRDVEEVQNPLSTPTRLFQRWSGRQKDTSPFGVVLRPDGDEAGTPPFESWQYRPRFLPSNVPLEVAVGTRLSEPELFYLGLPRRAGDMRDQPVKHTAPLREITSVRISIPAPPTEALRALAATGLVSFVSAPKPLLAPGREAWARPTSGRSCRSSSTGSPMRDTGSRFSWEAPS